MKKWEKRGGRERGHWTGLCCFAKECGGLGFGSVCLIIYIKIKNNNGKEKRWCCFVLLCACEEGLTWSKWVFLLTVGVRGLVRMRDVDLAN